MKKSKTITPLARAEYISQEEREQMNARDLEIINRNADQLNAEAEDILRYQSWPDDAS